MGAITVITSGKGGVGKSTTSVGLACALAQRGRRVLLIDGDAGLRSLDRMLGVEAELVYDISDVTAGRCEPVRAIYPCPGFPGLFLMPAPGRDEDTIPPDVMRRLVPLLAPYYDHVLIDSPAGVGMGFLSAAAAAQRALVVSNPDPVCVRDSSTIRRLLEEQGIREQRLVINRFQYSRFKKLGCFEDLDAMIDESGIRLIAVIPEDVQLAAAFAKAHPAPGRSSGAMAYARLAARLEGERVPLAPLRRL